MGMIHPNQKKIDEVDAFQKFMDESVMGNGGLMDSLEDGDYDNKFDIHITHNGKTISLEMDADAFDEMMTYLEMRKQNLEE
jgi:hypothetical protein